MENPDFCFSGCPWLALVIICICRVVFKLLVAWLDLKLEVPFEMGDTVWKMLCTHVERTSLCPSEFTIEMDKRQCGGNGTIAIPGGKPIFTAWRKHFSTFLKSLHWNQNNISKNHPNFCTNKWENNIYSVQGMGILFLLLFFSTDGTLKLLSYCSPAHQPGENTNYSSMCEASPS